MDSAPQAQLQLDQKIINQVFGDFISIKAEDFKGVDLPRVQLPKKVKCTLSGKPTWTSMPNGVGYADQSAVRAEASKHDWMYPKEPITSLDQLLKLVRRADFVQTSRTYDADEVYESDDIARSHHVYHSQNVIDSEYISSCSWIWESKYLLGCARSGASTFCIGLVEGQNCSSSYQVYGSNNIGQSMYIKSSYDLYECLFCSHITSKKFCIANMQFEEAEYHKIKKMALGWLLAKG